MHLLVINYSNLQAHQRFHFPKLPHSARARALRSSSSVLILTLRYLLVIENSLSAEECAVLVEVALEAPFISMLISGRFLQTPNNLSTIPPK